MYPRWFLQVVGEQDARNEEGIVLFVVALAFLMFAVWLNNKRGAG